MRKAFETGTSQKVMLHTIRLGADLWRQYGLRFDYSRNEVAVRIGPAVSTAQVPVPGTEAGGAAEVRLRVGVPMAPTHDVEYKIDIFGGPSFTFDRVGDQLDVRFLAWHRRWSHSVTLAAALGLAAAGIAALCEFVAKGGLTRFPFWAGLVIGLGLVGHILEDQLGFMGSNLVYPITRRRSVGLGLLRSGDAIPNFLTVWTAVALILFNLDRFSAQSLLDPRWFLGLGVVLPVIALGGLHQWRRRHSKLKSREALQQRDILSEMEEVEVA